MTKYMRIKLIGGSIYTQELDKIMDGLDGDLDGAEVGQKWEMELVEMNESEYNSLPDFEGH